MTREEVLKKVNEMFVEAFDNENLKIGYDTTSNDIEGWDSLMQMNIIKIIEDDFGIQFDMDEIMEMENIGVMVELILSHI